VTIVIHVISGLLAFAFYGQVARLADETLTDGSYTYWADFLALYAVYIVSFIVLRLVTNFVSRERVRFKMPVEWAGSILTAAVGAYLLAGFVGATMHTAMLSHDFLGKAILAEDLEHVELKLTRPDIAWLRLYGAVMWGSMPSAAGQQMTAYDGPMNKAAQQEPTGGTSGRASSLSNIRTAGRTLPARLAFESSAGVDDGASRFLGC
jgi:hypothetical protein